jgi:UDP-N-acetylglucosamine 2-epimerase (non-hydrolysing)
VHTGQNYDYNLNGVFFKDLGLADPELYLNAVGADLGETMGNIIAASYKAMVELKPDAVLVLGDTNSCLSVIGAKRLHIPIFHMEAGNRCKDECLPEETNRRIVDIISDVNLAYSEHARRYLADCGLPKERTYVTGSPMAEVLTKNLEKIKANLEGTSFRATPKWMEYDANTMTAKVLAVPAREDIDLPVEEHLIVELYSK